MMLENGMFVKAAVATIDGVLSMLLMTLYFLSLLFLRLFRNRPIKTKEVFVWPQGHMKNLLYCWRTCIYGD